MSYKSDIQATRSTDGNTGTAVIAQPIRLRGIIIASDNVGAGVLELTTTSNTGTTLFIGDVPQGDVMNIGLPDAGVVFGTGIYVALTNISRVTLFVQ